MHHNQTSTTTLIGRVLSAYLIVTAAGFVLSSGFFAGMIATTNSDPVMLNLSGMTHFFIGMTIVVLHFRWRGVHQIMVSLLGMLYVLKGTFLIALPELTLQTANNDLQASLIGPAIGFFLYGAVLAYFSWFKTSASAQA